MYTKRTKPGAGSAVRKDILPATISHGHWTFDIQNHLLYVDGRAVRVRRGVVGLLSFLVQHEGQILSKEDLIAGVWHGRDVSDGAIYNRVRALRAALRDEDGPQRCIHWEYGHGLRFTRPALHAPLTEVPSQLYQAAPALVAAQDPEPAHLPALDGFVGASPLRDWQHIMGVYHTI